VIGLGAVGAQILVPFAANLASEATRGRVVGNVMAGLLAGIMLARPVSSFVAHQFGWRAIFAVSAAAMLLLVALLRWRLPHRQPRGQASYGGILASLWPLVRDYPQLRRRGFYQAMLFMTFSMFWTGVPLVLSGPLFGLSQNGIALFALAGAGGALAAPLAGRMADRGWTRPVTGLSIAAAAGAMLLAAWAGGAGALVALAIAAVVADAFVQISLVMSQRVIYSLNPGARGRLNGVFVAFMFVFGAAGSALASVTYDIGGWHLTALTAAAPAMLALVAYGTEFLPVSATRRTSR
jgi:predicted MFS family arabinose efflux permease